MLQQLSGRSLETVKERAGGQVLSMHRIVQQKIKLGFDSRNHHNAFENALKLVRKKYPTASVVQIPDLPNWDEYRAVHTTCPKPSSCFQSNFDDQAII
jgi:hypothetical protein